MTDIDRVLRSNLKLRHLQLLVAIDRFRHLGRASEFLSVTQPAVSKTLAEIERMFDQTLFTRSTRGTEPTAVGSAVVRFARSVLAEYGRTRDEIAAVSGGGGGGGGGRGGGGGGGAGGGGGGGGGRARCWWRP
jgi:DNA-binding transcriptional LysR family regulator